MNLLLRDNIDFVILVIIWNIIVICCVNWCWHRLLSHLNLFGLLITLRNGAWLKGSKLKLLSSLYFLNFSVNFTVIDKTFLWLNDCIRLKCHHLYWNIWRHRYLLLGCYHMEHLYRSVNHCIFDYIAFAISLWHILTKHVVEMRVVLVECLLAFYIGFIRFLWSYSRLVSSLDLPKFDIFTKLLILIILLLIFLILLL